MKYQEYARVLQLKNRLDLSQVKVSLFLLAEKQRVIGKYFSLVINKVLKLVRTLEKTLYNGLRNLLSQIHCSSTADC